MLSSDYVVVFAARRCLVYSAVWQVAVVEQMLGRLNQLTPPWKHCEDKQQAENAAEVVVKVPHTLFYINPP